MERLLVRILVVVAIIQMRTLKTDVEQGSMRTVFGHGLVGPKWEVNTNKNKLFNIYNSQKGIRLIFLNQNMDIYMVT